ncbi:MAG: class I SAM-dependent methyltransferase [Elusimicrobia bacterium]|nr:class I SAM-dependent methyltransferase [Elusimicrobiota bacterium]
MNTELVTLKRNCPHCSSTASELIRHVPDCDERNITWPLLRCQKCGLVYVGALPQNPGIYYGSLYFKQGSSWAAQFNRYFATYWNRVRVFTVIGYPLNAASSRLLDFGCGSGYFLEAALHSGWETWGVEPDSSRFSLLSSKASGRIYSSLSELMTQEPGVRFHVITLWHVLEHLPDLKQILLKLNEMTQENGIIFLTLPNWGSWEAERFGDRWFHLDVPRHLQHFDAPMLKAVLSETGWTVEWIGYTAWAYCTYGLAQTFLNCLPGPKNFIFNLIKRGVHYRNRMGPLRFFSLVLLHVFLFPVALGVAALLMPLLACRGRAGTVDVWARKKPSVGERKDVRTFWYPLMGKQWRKN